MHWFVFLQTLTVILQILKKLLLETPVVPQSFVKQDCGVLHVFRT